MARRRAASAVTTISRHKITEIKQSPRVGTASPPDPNARLGRWFQPDLALFWGLRLRFGLAGQILFEPMDVVIALDNVGFPDQGPKQR